MKIAVSATGKKLSDKVDPRFGRARYILLVDQESMDIEAIDNSNNIQAFKGAGIQAATLLADKEVDVLLTGFCGPNAFRTLNAADIRVINNVSGTVEQAISAFNRGGVVYASEPNSTGYW